MTETKTESEAARVLAITLEREGPGGRPWCPRPTGERLRRAILMRDRSLSGLARRAVRVARMMTLCAQALGLRGGYVAVLYRLPLLRHDHLSALLAQAVRRGLASDAVAVTDTTIVLHEPGMAGLDGRPYVIERAGLPLIAAYLDAVQTMLGFDTVAQILDAATPEQAGTAEAAAQALHSRLRDWLADRLAPEHLQRQVSALADLCKRHGAEGAEAIDDALILQGWLDLGVTDSGLDGFRLFRNAARKTIAFRQALAEAEAEADSHHMSLDEDPDHGGIGDETLAEQDLVPVGRFVSPLAVLAAPPCDRVKWLKQTELATLAGFLDQAPLADDPDHDGADTGGTGLFGQQHPIRDLCLTVLRADLFGADQDRHVAAARRKRVPETQEETDYLALAAALDARLGQIDRLMLATLHVLIEEGRAEAVHLLPPGQGIPVDALRADIGPEDPDIGDAAVMARLLDLLRTGDAPPIVDLRKRAQAAYRSVNVAGFRPEDRQADGMTEALAAGAAWLPRLRDLVAGQVQAIRRRDLARDHAADRVVFTRAFAQLYGPHEAG